MPIDNDAMVHFLKALVRSESLPGQEKNAIDRVAAEMHHLGYDSIAIDIYGNLTGVINGAHSGPTLMLDAHVDTVGVAPGVPWHHEPFGATIDNNRMYGRGTTDMKGPLAAMLYAGAAADPAGLKGRVVFSVSVMEEVIEGYLLEPAVSQVRTRHGHHWRTLGPEADSRWPGPGRDSFYRHGPSRALIPTRAGHQCGAPDDGGHRCNRKRPPAGAS